MNGKSKGIEITKRVPSYPHKYSIGRFILAFGKSSISFLARGGPCAQFAVRRVWVLGRVPPSLPPAARMAFLRCLHPSLLLLSSLAMPQRFFVSSHWQDGRVGNFIKHCIVILYFRNNITYSRSKLFSV